MDKQEQSIDVKDLFSIAGKAALVTGGSRGIGLMIARGYVEAGAKVYISSRKKEACDRVAAELSEVGPCVSIPADLSTTEGCKHLAEELSARESALNILVNNAGAAWGAPLEGYPEAGFDKVMDTNVKGVFFLTQYLLPLLEKAARPGDPARVINVGSIDGIKVPFIDNYAYSPSKAAVHHMTRVLAVKLGERGITVNAVAPGPFESQMTRWLLENHRESIEATCPLNRIGAPADMAGVAIYLASRAGAYVNGVVIPVDGGICLK
ncbi:MAG TPA: SDR family oxidoreductase [Blastocatellia bacterium]|jgi:NAD(P)-dependent dehydrogenase (short-subunit alcohol dehydrogenase family)|nr:SDR family oxidoreductase [Blastocatellia bacterium]